MSMVRIRLRGAGPALFSIDPSPAVPAWGLAAM